jgi:hypothetical protein
VGQEGVDFRLGHLSRVADIVKMDASCSWSISFGGRAEFTGASTLDDRQTPFPWNPRLCGNLGYHCPKMVFWDLLARGKSPKVLFLKPNPLIKDLLP